MFNDMIGRDYAMAREEELRRAVKTSRPKVERSRQSVAVAGWLVLPVILAAIVGLVMA